MPPVHRRPADTLPRWLPADVLTGLPLTVRAAFLGNSPGAAARLAVRATTVVADPGAAQRLLCAKRGDKALVALCLLRVAEATSLRKDNASLRDPAWITLADRYGLWRLRYLLEDIRLRSSDPAQFALVRQLVRRQERAFQRLFRDIASLLRSGLDDAGLTGITIEFRQKNVAGIAEKMRRKGKGFNHITDIFGFRLIAGSVRDCYRAQEVLHRLWRPYPEHAADFISSPKPNGYQSLHSTVRCLQDLPVEFQIRTPAMHRIARFGPAAHHVYKALVRST